jgi:hypothetical protein
MNAKTVFVAALLLWACVAWGEEIQSNYNSSASSQPSAHWDTSPAHWDQVIREYNNSSALKLGKSDFVVTGPLVSGFRRQRLSSDRSLGEKIIGLPVVNLFVPQRMPRPPGGTGRYFAWGSKDQPWNTVTPPTPPGGAFDPIGNEPKSGLISVEW